MLAPCLAFFLGAISGLALCLSDYPVRVWQLQLVAFLPWLWALHPGGPSPTLGCSAAASLGLTLFYLVPLLRVLKLSIPLSMGLGCYQGLLWLLAGLGLHFVLRWPAPWGELGAGALLAFLAWLDFTILPVWGTAQCFARVLSAAPAAIQFIAVTGITGVVFVLLATQALLLLLLNQPAHWPQVIPALSAVIGIPTLYNLLATRRNPTGHLTVAALGWPGDMDSIQLMKSRYPELLRAAAGAGAKLAVSPETAFYIADRATWDEIFGKLAQRHGMALAVGAFDEANNDNRILFFDASGHLLDEYRKTHLVPFAEYYTRGDGRRVQVKSSSSHLGGMVCQDDNFTDLARGYGRDGAQVVAVPTNDWHAVKDFHLENSILRAIECRYGIVRAATNGISAIISPRGEILARRDHYQEGAGALVAEMPLFSRPPTIYARYGDWFPVACAVAIIALACHFR